MLKKLIWFVCGVILVVGWLVVRAFVGPGWAWRVDGPRQELIEDAGPPDSSTGIENEPAVTGGQVEWELPFGAPPLAEIVGEAAAVAKGVVDSTPRVAAWQPSRDEGARDRVAGQDSDWDLDLDVYLKVMRDSAGRLGDARDQN